MYTALAQGEKKNHEQRPIKEQISEANLQKQRAKKANKKKRNPYHKNRPKK